MSTDKKKFLRLKLLCKAFQIEEEMFDDLDDEYGRLFSKDFRKENEYLIIKRFTDSPGPDEGSFDPEESIEQTMPSGDCLKKLHRALARATHPDITGHEEDFKKVQEAYETNDVVTLLLEVTNRNLDIDLTTPELAELEKKLESQKEMLEDKKKTLRWAWAESNKNEELRDLIRKNLGINPKKFKDWIESLKQKEDK